MKSKRVLYYGIPVLGILFCLIYLNRAVIDVVYTDYIRLINSYLPDVWNPDKFFVADVLTRIPLNYLERILNVTLFGYNTLVEMVLGVLGLGASGFVLAEYCRKHQVTFGWYCLIMLFLFSLNKWEMLTNGTGWVHFVAFACFYYHYLVLDRVYRGETKNGDRIRMCLLPAVITLGVAGPYCAVYSATIILSCIGICILRIVKSKSLSKSKSEIQTWGLYAVCTLIPLLLYIWSNSHTIEEHAGAVDTSLMAALIENPLFFIEFLLKSFASMVLGEEAIRKFLTQEWQIMVLGGFVIGGYLLALYLNFKYKIYEKTVLPLMFLMAGGMNHVLILFSRWIFMRPDYGMSSRYALQFQIGIIGIFLTFAFSVRKKKSVRHNKELKWLCVCVSVIFLAGNLYTINCEWKTAPYRKQNLIEKREAALHYEELSDQELEEIFQYKKGPDQIRNALGILKENGWNVFRK